MLKIINSNNNTSSSSSSNDTDIDSEHVAAVVVGGLNLLTDGGDVMTMSISIVHVSIDCMLGFVRKAKRHSGTKEKKKWRKRWCTVSLILGLRSLGKQVCLQAPACGTLLKNLLPKSFVAGN